MSMSFRDLNFDEPNDIEAKKELLQREIIDKNLNKEHFIEFCSAKKVTAMT